MYFQLPGLSLFVLFRYEEPYKVSVAQSALFVNLSVPEHQSIINHSTHKIYNNVTRHVSFQKLEKNKRMSEKMRDGTWLQLLRIISQSFGGIWLSKRVEKSHHSLLLYS